MGVRFDFRVPGSLDFTGLLENSILIAVAYEKYANHKKFPPKMPQTGTFCRVLQTLQRLRIFLTLTLNPQNAANRGKLCPSKVDES